MTGGWTLVLAVLGAGLGLGVLLTRMLRRTERGDAPSPHGELHELESRQRDLYARLREVADPDEREALEVEAARNLQDIDRLRATLPPVGPREHGPGSAATKASTAPRRATLGRTLAGFAAGVGATLLLGWLVLSAQRDARPRPEDSGAGGPPAEHPEGAELSAPERARLDELRAGLAANPSDLALRKQYALALLGTEQFFGAFSESQEILRERPADPDALYVQGMVRLQMGQDPAAVELFDQVLAQYPEHVLALTAKGAALLRQGNGLGARLLWQQALAASGGRNPDVESLLALLGERADGEPSGEVAEPVAAPEPSSPASPSYPLRVELARGATPAAGATLFVVLRGEAPGPPAAVRRISTPAFPLELELTGADSMLGRPLPERGTLGVRLDADGDASTRDEGDLVTEAPAVAGSPTTLRLGGG